MSQELPAAAEGPEDALSSKMALRWGQNRRLEFLDFRLQFEGRFNRSDLTSFFGISTPQATTDISRYIERAPDNAVYDGSTRGYVATTEFKPLFPTNDPSRFLNELLARTTDVLPAEQSFLGWMPSTVTVPSPVRRLEPATVLAVLTAIRRGIQMNVAYQSMSSSEPSVRMVSPHGVAFDGFRWHVRAYCHMRHEFRDFVLARILDVQPTDEPGKSAAEDTAWHQVVSLVLAPNSRLPKSTRRVIELDYAMENGEVVLECRQAVLFYALKRLGLLNADSTNPEEQQIVLRNRAAVMKFLRIKNE